MSSQIPKPFRVPKSVQVVVMREAVRSQDGRREFLLLRRLEERGGFWQPVTGRVEADESYEQAARREATEETGFRAETGRLIDLGYTHSYPLKTEWLVNYPPSTTHNDEAAFALLVPPETEIRLDPSEHDGFGWFSCGEALDRLIWHGNRAALRRAASLKNDNTCIASSFILHPSSFLWQLAKRSLRLGERTLLMGILNVTPDSFSDGGNFSEVEQAVEQALKLEAQGADIVDIGGESTRPGAQVVTVEEELARILPVIEKLQGRLKIPISVDTYKASVAKAALAAGAEIVNDISGLRFDPELASVAARFQAGLVLMHSRGTPDTLHGHPPVADILTEVQASLQESVQQALFRGVVPEQIVLDPGIGFGKTGEENLRLLHGLDRMAGLGYPLLVGTSRKSFIGKITGKESPQDRLWGTAASVAVVVLRGARIVRVHDVAEMRDCVLVADAILKASSDTP